MPRDSNLCLQAVVYPWGWNRQRQRRLCLIKSLIRHPRGLILQWPARFQGDIVQLTLSQSNGFALLLVTPQKEGRRRGYQNGRKKEPARRGATGSHARHWHWITWGSLWSFMGIMVGWGISREICVTVITPDHTMCLEQSAQCLMVQFRLQMACTVWTGSFTVA